MNKKIKGYRIAVMAFALGFLQLFTSAAADPLVQFPTGNAAWTVDITYDREAPTPDVTPGRNVRPVKKAKKVEVAQTNDTRRTRITWTDGTTTEQWTIPNMPVIFKEYPNGVVFPLQTTELEVKLDTFETPSDISTFSWVTPKTLQGKDPESYKGQLCYHYAGTVSPPGRMMGHSSESFTPPTRNREAWIDSKNLFPVLLKTENSICIFTLLPPPATPLEMPPKFKKGVAYYKHLVGLP